MREQSWPSTWTSSSPGPPAGWWGPCTRRWTYPEQLWERWCWGWIRYLKISIKSCSIDGNPAHNSKRTQVRLKKNLTGGVKEEDPGSQLPWLSLFWLFFRWRPWIKGQSKSSKKTRDLIHYIMEVMGFLTRNTVAKSCKRFRSRIDAVVAADGNFIA